MNSVCDHSIGHGSADGFTLIELLVATLILAILMTIVFASFTSVTATMETARDASNRLRFRQIVWRNLSSNLQAVYLDAAALQPEYEFLGESKQGAFGPADSLRFVSTMPMPGARSLPGMNKVVTYEVMDRNAVSEEIASGLPPDDDRQGAVLVMREEPLQLESQDFVTRASDPGWDIIERAVPVASVEILFFDGIQNEWREDWNSTDERRLPGGIWVKISFPRTEDERSEEFRSGINPQEHPDLEFMTSLPLGRGVELPFPDFNHVRFDAYEEF